MSDADVKIAERVINSRLELRDTWPLEPPEWRKESSMQPAEPLP